MTNNWLAVVGVQMMGVKAKLDQALQTANARISNDSENDTRAPVDEERESERERKRQELDQSYRQKKNARALKKQNMAQKWKSHKTTI
mmetsp:Transcript_20608/g.37288  ORF Transcript_20608/g.37288 Transcript_20608/m.37288 type:complete len:88 (+) Transcript_20608:138-401(+)